MDAGTREKIIDLNTCRYGQWDVEPQTIRSKIEMCERLGYVIGGRKAEDSVTRIVAKVRKYLSAV